jgi:hypothetical protein
MLDRIAALPAAPASVQVKPMVWDDSLKGRWIGTPPTPLGNMAFWIFHDPSGFWRATTAPGKLYYPTIEAAKAAAQADCAARILAAIDVQPAPDASQIRADALREAVAIANQHDYSIMSSTAADHRANMIGNAIAYLIDTPPPPDAMADRVAALVEAAKGIMAHMPDHPDTAWQDLTEALAAMKGGDA